MRSLRRAGQSCLDPRRTGTMVLAVIFNALDTTGHLSRRLHICCNFRDIPSDASRFYRYNHLGCIFRKEVCILSKLTCWLNIWILSFMPTASSLTVLLRGARVFARLDRNTELMVWGDCSRYFVCSSPLLIHKLPAWEHLVTLILCRLLFWQPLVHIGWLIPRLVR